MTKPIDFESGDLDAVIAGAGDRVLLEFWAPWCGYCVRMAPDLERLAAERGIALVRVNADEAPDESSKWGTKTLPNLILLGQGREIARRGSGNFDALSAWIDEQSA